MKEVNPKETTRAYAFEDVDECAHAHAHLFQNAGCKPSHPDKQTEESEIQYADVLAHRTGSQQYQGILYAPRRQKAHTI